MNRLYNSVFSLSLAFLLLFFAAVHGANAKTVLNIKSASFDVLSEEHPDITRMADLLKYAAEKFRKLPGNGDIKINVSLFNYIDREEFIDETLGTPSAPDIVVESIFDLISYAHKGLLVPLDDVLTPDFEGDIDKRSLRHGMISGKLYMLPFMGMQNLLAFNKKMFMENGLEKYVVDKPLIQHWTYEQWQEVLDTLAKNLKGLQFPFMMYGKNRMGDMHIMTLIRQFGSPFYDGNGRVKINTPEGIAGLRWIQDGVGKGYFPGGCENLELADNTELFSLGQLAISMQNNILVSILPKDIDVGWVNFPGPGRGLNTEMYSSFCIFDNKDAKKIHIAKKFLTYFFGSREYLNFSQIGLPVSKGVYERHKAKYPLWESNIENRACNFHFFANQPDWAGVRASVYPVIHKLLSGDLTPEEAAVKIEEDCNKVIDQGWKNSRLSAK